MGYSSDFNRKKGGPKKVRFSPFLLRKTELLLFLSAKSVIQSCIFLFFMHVFYIGRSQHLYFQGVMRLFDWPNFLVAAKGEVRGCAR